MKACIAIINTNVNKSELHYELFLPLNVFRVSLEYHKIFQHRCRAHVLFSAQFSSLAISQQHR